jgi:hypothetical protein
VKIPSPFLISALLCCALPASAQSTIWNDSARLAVAFPASSVRMGHDGAGWYVFGNNWYGMYDAKTAENPSKASLAFVYPFSVKPEGKTTQWVKFTFKSNNFFNAEPGAHVAIFSRANNFSLPVKDEQALFPPSNYAILNAEGKGIILGREKPAGQQGTYNSSCPTDGFRVFFESRIFIRSYSQDPLNANAATAGVKCAEPSPGKTLKDGVTYTVELHVNDDWISYWIWEEGTPWPSRGTPFADYQGNPGGPHFNNQFVQYLSNPAFWSSHSQMNANSHGFTIAPVLLGNSQAWSIEIGMIGAHWF